jgi:hypothetical protein
MSEHLTFSFSHLFELARELSISLDQGGCHSRNGHARAKVTCDVIVLERTSSDRVPPLIDLVPQRARHGDARLERAFPDRQPLAPSPDRIGPTRPLHGGLDQRPPKVADRECVGAFQFANLIPLFRVKT